MKKTILNAPYTNKSYEEKEALKALDNEKHTSLEDNLVQQLGGALFPVETDVNVLEMSDPEIDDFIMEEVYTEDIQFKEDQNEIESVPSYNFDNEVVLEDALDGYDVKQSDGQLVFSLSNNLCAKNIIADKKKKRKIKQAKYQQIDEEVESLYAQFQHCGYDFEYDMPAVEVKKPKSKKVCDEWNATKPAKSVNGPRYIKKIRRKK